MAAFEAVLSLRWISQTAARGEAKISISLFVPFFAALILVAGCSVRSAQAPLEDPLVVAGGEPLRGTRLASGAHAYCGAEITYVFDTADDWLPADSIDRELTAAMQAYWINFAMRADPNGTALPKWAQYDSEARRILELGDEIRSANGEWVELCGLIAGYR